MIQDEILKQIEELDRQLRRIPRGSAKETKILTQRSALEAQLADLPPEQSMTTPSPETPYTTAEGVSAQQKDQTMQALDPITLRSEPIDVSRRQACRVFELNPKWQPQKYIRNVYELLGNVVIDRSTGLMWEQGGSVNRLAFEGAQFHLEGLNNRDYTDWRLPTIPELISLLEKEEQEQGLYISTCFDKTQSLCWSADQILKEDHPSSNEGWWNVDFQGGLVRWDLLQNRYYVRAVRSWEEK